MDEYVFLLKTKVPALPLSHSALTAENTHLCPSVFYPHKMGQLSSISWGSGERTPETFHTLQPVNSNHWGQVSGI